MSALALSAEERVAPQPQPCHAEYFRTLHPDRNGGKWPFKGAYDGNIGWIGLPFPRSAISQVAVRQIVQHGTIFQFQLYNGQRVTVMRRKQR